MRTPGRYLAALAGQRGAKKAPPGTEEEVLEVALTARMAMRMPAAHSTASLMVSTFFCGYLMLSSSQ